MSVVIAGPLDSQGNVRVSGGGGGGGGGDVAIIAPLSNTGEVETKVMNFPETQEVVFSSAQPVTVDNFPATQDVVFSTPQPVYVDNFPVNQYVIVANPEPIEVQVSDLPIVSGAVVVSGNIDIGNLPTVQRVEVDNFPSSGDAQPPIPSIPHMCVTASPVAVIWNVGISKSFSSNGWAPVKIGAWNVTLTRTVDPHMLTADFILSGFMGLGPASSGGVAYSHYRFLFIIEVDSNPYAPVAPDLPPLSSYEPYYDTTVTGFSNQSGNVASAMKLRLPEFHGQQIDTGSNSNYTFGINDSLVCIIPPTTTGTSTSYAHLAVYGIGVGTGGGYPSGTVHATVGLTYSRWVLPPTAV